MSDGAQLIGTTGRSYTLEFQLARGGQGEVWAAVADDGEEVAIKLADLSRVSQEALRQESALLRLLADNGVPGVVPNLDEVELDGRPGFVMPRCPGHADTHVAGLIARWPGTAIEAVLGFCIEVASALAALHGAALELPDGRAGQLVHRDVKPENILLDHEGRVWLADLGGTLVVDPAVNVRLAVFGTPLWAPYDQLLPGITEPDPTWDTYALCVCMFWWLTGARPAYQADPSPMLTQRGHEIWAALIEVASQTDATALREAHRKLNLARAGTKEDDLVDVRGHAAIQPEDREALSEGLARLASQEVYGEEALYLAVRDLCEVLARGLSALSHPSPPNRFWDALQLAAEIDAVRLRLVSAREARDVRADHAVMAARVAQLEEAAAPRTRPLALPIHDASTDEQGIDPVPSVVSPPRAPLPPPPRSPLAGIAIGAALFALMSLPLGWKLYHWVQDSPAIPSPRSAPSAVSVAGGSFFVGDTTGVGQEDERPVRQVSVTGFRIDRLEVSNAAWRACVDASVCPPLPWADPDSPYHAGGSKAREFQGLTGDDQPAVGVTWSAAQTWCAWRQGRLPSEEEWEMAATWTKSASTAADKKLWPWGTTAPDCTHANIADCARNTTLPVDSLPDGASDWGAVQLVGNVWEWTSGRYPVTVKQGILKQKRKEELHYVLRGGAFNSDAASSRPTFRRHWDPDAVSPVHGFRCVYDK